MKLWRETTLKLAIPNKGRLREPSLDILREAGFVFRIKDRTPYTTCTNFDMILVFLRAEDIPILVDQGAVDMGITGEDLILEKNVDVVHVLPLEFGRCRICVAISKKKEANGLASLAGKTVATPFPNLARSFFDQQQLDARCVEMSGSVEVAVSLGWADGIVEVVETGDSLRENQLTAAADIGHFQATLITNYHKETSPLVSQVKNRLKGIVIARHYALLEYNVPREKLEQAKVVTPGYDAPTISSLENPKWCAVRVMVPQKDIPAVMDELEKMEASAVIQMPIQNCRL